MRKNLFVLLVIIAYLSACSGGNKITKLTDQGMAAFNKGDYATALEVWEPVIKDYLDNDRESECPLYGMAGQAAFKLGMFDKGQEYMQQAIYYKSASPADLVLAAEEYRKIDNLSKEIETLETYLERFPSEAGNPGVRERLFETYIESENWTPAIDIWPSLPEETRSSLDFMEDYFLANARVDNNEVCEEYAGKILEVDPENIPAMEFFGKKYYKLAEDRYQAEMEAYEKNKTNKQYAQLLKAFETVTENFKTSLGYFTKLYELDPSPDYARYLANIYARLDDKKKSEYYMGLIK
jgi:tetratricopeptide (TPR) repeat protein